MLLGSMLSSSTLQSLTASSNPLNIALVKHWPFATRLLRISISVDRREGNIRGSVILVLNKTNNKEGSIETTLYQEAASERH